MRHFEHFSGGVGARYTMKRMRTLSHLVLLILIGAVASLTFSPSLNTFPQSVQAQVKLNEADRALVTGSRNAIVRTGTSEAYFDRHYTLVKVVNQPGDRRVVWKLSVNEYATNVVDVLGYYTANGKRVDTHSVNTTLRRTSDIKDTISRRKANQIMQRCIGTFRNPAVEFRAADTDTARLFLTAESVPRHRIEMREQEERQTKSKTATGSDVVEKEGKKGPPIMVGSVDLQTGKCTKGYLLIGPQRPR